MIKIAKSPAIGGDFIRNNPRRMPGRPLLRSAAVLLALGTLAAPASARPFQQYLNGSSRASATLCKINFAKVGAGLRLDVSNVSCYIRMKDGAGGAHVRAAQFLVLGADPNTTVSALTIVPSYVQSQFGESVFSANHVVRAFANAQQRFQAYVEIDHGSFSQLACHISGDLTKA